MPRCESCNQPSSSLPLAEAARFAGVPWAVLRREAAAGRLRVAYTVADRRWPLRFEVADIVKWMRGEAVACEARRKDPTYAAVAAGSRTVDF